METLAQLNNVVKRFGKHLALNQLNLSITAGEIVALLGPNGAGKTTAVSALLNLITVDHGEVQLCGRSPDDRSARQQTGVMLQDNSLPDTLKVAELIELTQSYYPRPRTLDEVSAMAGIDDLLPRLYGKLSGGQQRRVQFALAICAHVDILFLDEPSVGLDIEAREALWRCVRQLSVEGCAVVLTTHYLEEAEALAHRVIVMANGAVIAEGSVDAIRARVAQRRVHCVSSLRAEDVASWPEVSSAHQEGATISIQSADVEALIQKLFKHDPNLQQLDIKRAGLAEAFSKLTRESVQ